MNQPFPPETLSAPGFGGGYTAVRCCAGGPAVLSVCAEANNDQLLVLVIRVLWKG